MDLPVNEAKSGGTADRADGEIQRSIDAGIAKARAELATGPRLMPKGSCYNCYEPFHGGDHKTKIFCDSDCRDDYERITANLKYR